MLQTANYALKKIDLTDSPPDITVFNPNFDTIDAKLKEIEDNKVDELDIGTIPASNKIPKALPTGKLDIGWIPETGQTKIVSVTLASTMTQVDFENLNLEDYRELSIIYLLSNTLAGSSGGLTVRFNDDAGSNYKYNEYRLTTVLTRTVVATATGVIFKTGIGATDKPVLGKILISNTAFKKTILAEIADEPQGVFDLVRGNWENLGKINKISFIGSFKAGSHITIMGVK